MLSPSPLLPSSPSPQFEAHTHPTTAVLASPCSLGPRSRTPPHRHVQSPPYPPPPSRMDSIQKQPVKSALNRGKKQTEKGSGIVTVPGLKKQTKQFVCDRGPSRKNMSSSERASFGWLVSLLVLGSYPVEEDKARGVFIYLFYILFILFSPRPPYSLACSTGCNGVCSFV